MLTLTRSLSLIVIPRRLHPCTGCQKFSNARSTKTFIKINQPVTFAGGLDWVRAAHTKIRAGRVAPLYIKSGKARIFAERGFPRWGNPSGAARNSPRQEPQKAIFQLPDYNLPQWS